MTIPDMTINKKEYLTIGQLLFVQLGLHIKLEDSSQGKTLALVNIDRDPFHLQYLYWYCQYWYLFCQYFYWFCSNKYWPFSPSRLSPAFCDSPPLQREHPRQPLIREISLKWPCGLVSTTWCNSFLSIFFLSKLRIETCPKNTWSSGWEGVCSLPAPGSLWATSLKDIELRGTLLGTSP